MIKKGVNRYLLAREALSHLMDAAKEFDPEITSIDKFSAFAAQRCIFRLIDEYRTINRGSRAQMFKKRLVENLENQSLNENGYIDKSLIDKELKENKAVQYDQGEHLSYDDKRFRETLSDPSAQIPFSEMELNDEIAGLAKRCDRFFVGPDKDDSKLRKKLVIEYIIPRLKKEDYKGLAQIASENQIPIGKAYKLLKDKNMMSFMSNYYKNLGIHLNEQEWQ